MHHRLQQGLIAIVLCMLSACVSGPPPGGALVPTGIVLPGASQVTVLAATSRAREPGGLMFDAKRAKSFEGDFARIVVSIPPGHVPGEIQWPGRAPGDPAEDFTTLSRDYLDTQGYLAALHEELLRRPLAERDVLIFVHGYNTDFDEAVYRLAQFVKDSGFKGVSVVFSLASEGTVFGYGYDRESVTVARDALGRLLSLTAKDEGVPKISILAHSLGCLLTIEALRDAAIAGDATFDGKLTDIVLAAPDIDVDVFHAQLHRIGQVPGRMAVLVSTDDGALRFSSRLSGDSPRLGEYANAAEFTRSGITIIDISRLEAGEFAMMNHDKIFASEGLAQLVGANLGKGEILGGPPPSAAESLTDQLSRLGETLGDSVKDVLDVIIIEPAKAVTGGQRR